MPDKKVKDFYTNYSDKIIDKRLNSPYPIRRYVHARQYESILRYVEPGAKVLDAGCGEGVLSVMMARKGATVTGCDISRPNIERCRAYARENNVDIEFIQADSENLPFKNENFDLVVSSHVLEHLPDFDQGLRELMRVTKKRTVVAIPTINNLCSWVVVGHGWFYLKGIKSFLSLFTGLAKMIIAFAAGREGVDERYAGNDVPHIFRFVYAMKKRIRKNNFKLISYEAPSLCFPFFESLLPIAKFLEKFREKKFFRNMGYGTTFIIEK